MSSGDTVAPSGSALECTVDGHRACRLRSGDGRLEATFVPGARMVCWSLRHDREELLDQRQGLTHFMDSGEPAGLPLLYPWANRLSRRTVEVAERRIDLERVSSMLCLDVNGLPLHGLARMRPDWRMVTLESTRDCARLGAQLDWAAHPRLLSAYPFPHVVEIDAEITNRDLTLRTSIVPTANAAVPVSFGYHPYFRLAGPAPERWWMQAPVAERLEVDDRLLPTGRRVHGGMGAGPLNGRDFDAEFPWPEAPGSCTLIGAGRILQLRRCHGYSFLHVFRAAEARYMCLEPMTAPTNALVTGADLPIVAPGSTFVAAFKVAVASSAPGAMPPRRLA